jgi:hypothetical protein
MELRAHLAIGACRQEEMGERIGMVRVAPELRHHHVGAEPADRGGNDRVEGLEPRIVAGVRGQGDVDRAVWRVGPAPLRQVAGAGEQEPVLVDRDREHARVVPEGELHPVAVVDVDVDVGHSLGSVGQEPGDRDRGVVVDAEAGGP